MKVALNDAQDVKDEVTDSELQGLLEGSLQSVCENLDNLDNILEL